VAIHLAFSVAFSIVHLILDSAILSRLGVLPTAIHLDVQMPEMDGFSVVREVGPERMPAIVSTRHYPRQERCVRPLS
jgi:CheY-like chemotaxis protein